VQLSHPVDGLHKLLKRVALQQALHDVGVQRGIPVMTWCVCVVCVCVWGGGGVSK
jgi:hypothetical protein